MIRRLSVVMVGVGAMTTFLNMGGHDLHHITVVELEVKSRLSVGSAIDGHFHVAEVRSVEFRQ